MSWNYRIVRYADGTGYGLHEVHYDKKGKPESMTEEPASFVTDEDEGNPISGILKQLAIAQTDISGQPIFDEPKEWTK